MQTRCGGSGRGGGYHVTTYSAWASVVWTWFGETRSFSRLEGPAEANESFDETDSHGDRLYNSGTTAWLETGEPPLTPPTPPTGVSASVSVYEAGEANYLRMQVGWTPAGETAGLITSSTVTATPVGSPAPVLSATASGTSSGASLQPAQPNTTYRVTVTNTDSEGTSEPSEAIEISTPNSDGEPENPPPNGGIRCEQDQGTIKLSPGLEETPHVESITVKGHLAECEGVNDVTEAAYTAHLRTSEEVTCSTLSSASLEASTESLSFTVKWLPKEAEAGSSTGTLAMPISEVSLEGFEGLAGTLTGGPFPAGAKLVAASLYESFEGAGSCGAPPPGKNKAKPVKKGVFVTSPVEIEP